MPSTVSSNEPPDDSKGPKRSLFTRFSQCVSAYAGKPATFIIALAIIVVWGVSGPVFGFNDTWQLVINTSTTIVTFLMVFVIQNSQNRDTAALQIKLDELIMKLEGPREALLDLEELDEDALEAIRAEYEATALAYRKEAKEGPPKTNGKTAGNGTGKPPRTQSTRVTATRQRTKALASKAQTREG